LRTPLPIRFAGTWSRYSKNAMPQLAATATRRGFARRFLKCAYQANVMKMFEHTRSPAVVATVFRFNALLTFELLNS
jgi:hypothetical protein